MHPQVFCRKNFKRGKIKTYKKETDKRKFPRKNKYLKIQNIIFKKYIDIFIKNIRKNIIFI